MTKIVALKQRDRFSFKISFIQILLRVARAIHFKKMSSHLNSKMHYRSYSYTLLTQNNQTILKIYLKSVSIRNFWIIKNQFLWISIRNVSLSKNFFISSEPKMGWFRQFSKQTKSAVICRYKKSFILCLIKGHPRV